MTTTELYNIYKAHPEISTDTRSLKPGDLFFCLRGDNFDGNRFATEAINSGACCAITDEPSLEGKPGIVLVENVLKCLQDLAKFHRSQLSIPVIGITGSNGKTTTKELMACVLGKKHKVFATHGNLNNHIGVPLSVLGIRNHHEMAIIEMGANHVGEIRELCKIARPQSGIITNVGKAHLEGFGSFENVIKAKTELYEHLKENSGLVFVNNSNTILKNHTGSVKVVTYGTNPSSDVYINFLVANPYMKVYWENPRIIIESKLIGKYNFENIAGAVAIGQHFGVEPSLIKEAIEAYVPSNARSQLIQKGSNTIIMDAYNANPTSMNAALENFDMLASPSKIVMLGDMLELGKYSEEEHARIIEKVHSCNFHRVFLVGKIFSHVCSRPDYLTFQTSAELRNYLKNNPVDKSLVLVKGSRGIKMENVLEAL